MHKKSELPLRGKARVAVLVMKRYFLMGEDVQTLHHLKGAKQLKEYYCILIKLRSDRELSVGRLGNNFYFPRGYYVYVGRAKKNIEARIDRHCRKEKIRHWHIDYLSTAAEVIETITFGTEVGSECNLARKLQELEGRIIVKGFGSSDCCCSSHLLYFAARPSSLFHRISSSFSHT